MIRKRLGPLLKSPPRKRTELSFYNPPDNHSSPKKRAHKTLSSSLDKASYFLTQSIRITSKRAPDIDPTLLLSYNARSSSFNDPQFKLTTTSRIKPSMNRTLGSSQEEDCQKVIVYSFLVRAFCGKRRFQGHGKFVLQSQQATQNQSHKKDY